MPRAPSVPSYRHHKPSGQAVVTIRAADGQRRDVYLGVFNSPESRAEYGRLIAELAAGPPAPRPTAGGPGLTVDQVLLAFWAYADGHYRRPDGTPTQEVSEYRQTLKVVSALYGRTPAAAFGPVTEVTVLDPACGSGNFLYLALRMLLDLEKELWAYAAARDITYLLQVSPRQLRGLEVNTYARELAQVAIWIGFLQWHKFNGFRGPENPVLDPMEAIRQGDAIMDPVEFANPKEPQWPAAEFIVGNPPFLGDKKMRTDLGGDYVDGLRQLYAGRLPAQADLCC